MTLINVEKYSNKELTLFAIIGGAILGMLLFSLDAKPVFVFSLVGTLLTMVFIKYIWFWFILFIGSLPFNSFLAIDIGAPLRLSYLLFVIVYLSVAYTIYKKTQSGEQTRSDIFERFKTPFDKEIIIVFFVIAVSIFQSQSILPNSPVTGDTVLNYPWIKSIVKFLLLGVLLTVFYVTVFIINSKEKLKLVLFWYGTVVCIYSFYGIISYLFFLFGFHPGLFGFESIIQHDPAADIPRIRSVAEEPLFFGFYILMVIFIFIRIWFDHMIKREKVSRPYILSISIAFMLSALFLTLSRSAWLGFFGGLACLMFFFCKDVGSNRIITALSISYKSLFHTTAKRRIVSFIALFLLLVLCVSFLIWQVTDAFNSGGNRYWSTKTRLITYEQAIDALLDHPFLGIGYENFNFHSGNKWYPGLVDFNFNWTEVNNYPLKVLAELGLIGFLVLSFLYLKVVVLSVKNIFSAKDIFIRVVLIGSFATLIATSIVLLFSSSIIMPYLWVSAGIFVAAMKLNRAQGKKVDEQ